MQDPARKEKNLERGDPASGQAGSNAFGDGAPSRRYF
jgi:hypothetical protein